jgi:hypothetical protein
LAPRIFLKRLPVVDNESPKVDRLHVSENRDIHMAKCLEGIETFHMQRKQQVKYHLLFPMLNFLLDTIQ